MFAYFTFAKIVFQKKDKVLLFPSVKLVKKIHAFMKTNPLEKKLTGLFFSWCSRGPGLFQLMFLMQP